MIDDIESREADRPIRRDLPILAAPVDRTPAGAARDAESGIEPSGWLDDAIGIATKFGI